MITFQKQPNDLLDFDLRLDDWLSETAPDDTVQSMTVSVDPETIDITGTEIHPDYVKIWVDNGIDRTNYKFTANIVTTQGREIEADFRMMIRDL